MAFEDIDGYLKQLLLESYLTHDDLLLPTINKNSQLIMNGTKHMTVCFRITIIILIALHLNQKTFTGYYSIKFNNNDIENLFLFLLSLDNNILTAERKFFPELFHNNKLTDIEKNKIIVIYNTEKEQLRKSVYDILNQNPLEPIYFDFLLENNYTSKVFIYLQSQKDDGNEIITNITTIKDFFIDLSTKPNMNKIYLPDCIDSICEQYKIEKKLIEYSLTKNLIKSTNNIIMKFYK